MSVLVFKIPVYFVHGQQDITTPQKLTKKYIIN